MKRTTKSCSYCTEPTLPRLAKPLCKYHWYEGVYGRAWASHVDPEHPAAIKLTVEAEVVECSTC